MVRRSFAKAFLVSVAIHNGGVVDYIPLQLDISVRVLVWTGCAGFTFVRHLSGGCGPTLVP